VKRLTWFLCVLAAPLFGAEGMWMPQQIPQLGPELRKLGIKIDPQRFADLTGDPMGAVISLGGCSASFVSPEGLIVTNHHCSFGALQFNSTPQRDLITNGFLAKTKEEELPSGPGSRVFVTTTTEDVTPRVTGKLSPKLSDLEREKAVERNIKELVGECDKPGLRCRISTFFEGSQYIRTTQMEIRDVRLVYAPALGIGNFGGETDNWMWPRHTGDWSYLRAYVGKDGKPADYSKDNVPYRPAHYLKVSAEGLHPGDFVLVAGYPGRTLRYRTAAEVKAMQEYTYPTTLRYATDLNAILRDVGKNDKSIQIANAGGVKGNDNQLKNYTGTLNGFRNFGIVGQRQKREADLDAWIAAHPAEAKEYAGALAEMNALSARTAATRPRDTVYSWILRASPMLSQGWTLYRLSLERPKADLDREPNFQERDWPRIAENVARTQKTIEPKSDRAGLRYFVEESQKLPADQRLKALDDAIANAGGVEPFLDRLYANTKLADLKERQAMQAETTAQLLARNDAMLNLIAALMPMDLETEARDDAVIGAMTRVRPLYLQALRTMTGGRLYPDANSTLRITFGNVKGYVPRDGVTYVPQTTVQGVLQKNTGRGEFSAPKAELDAIRAGKTAGYADPRLGSVPVDFLSDLDTTGGSSGSPTLNAKGELCGLLFDGTYEALGNDFIYDPSVTRAIHVDAVYMLWVIDAVDGAHNLLKEMGLPVRFE